jgi:uncharacterized protein
MTMPGQPRPEFSLITSLTPRGRANMAAFMEVNSNPQSKGYGKIEVLELPQDTTIRGPQQVQNDFESNATVASALTLLRQGGSSVTEGNLITLPVGGGLVYFEPVYVSQAASGSSGAYPTLQGMLVYYNGQVGYAPTLQQAMAKVFGTAPVPTSTGTSPPPSTASRGTSANATVLKYLQQAESDYSLAEAALKSGNFGAYGTDLALMKTALDNATNAAKGTGHAAAPSPKPSPTPSPSPSR